MFLEDEDELLDREGFEEIEDDEDLLEEEETLEELDVDDRGHVRPRRHRSDESEELGPEFGDE